MAPAYRDGWRGLFFSPAPTPPPPGAGKRRVRGCGRVGPPTALYRVNCHRPVGCLRRFVFGRQNAKSAIFALRLCDLSYFLSDLSEHNVA